MRRRKTIKYYDLRRAPLKGSRKATAFIYCWRRQQLKVIVAVAPVHWFMKSENSISNLRKMKLSTMKIVSSFNYLLINLSCSNQEGCLPHKSLLGYRKEKNPHFSQFIRYSVGYWQTNNKNAL